VKPVTKNRLESQREFEFTTRDFERVRDLIYGRAGISLNDSKHELVYCRLSRRLRASGLTSFAHYLDHLESGRDQAEWEAFTNALTTNLTSFFREAHHFPLLAEHLRHSSGPVAIWSAAASTGEEPYSIAMTVSEVFDKAAPPVRIVATDIDTNVLATAEKGIYPVDRLDKLSAERSKRFFLKGKGSQTGLVRVRPELQAMIVFDQLNLLADRWDIAGPFDAIFCRNVMIYFDKATQKKILSRFAPLLKSNGLLFAGHSENFVHVSDAFKLRANTVYQLAGYSEPAGRAPRMRNHV
jgi:chemotaxis protein methyltransferase CheR